MLFSSSIVCVFMFFGVVVLLNVFKAADAFVCIEYTNKPTRQAFLYT